MPICSFYLQNRCRFGDSCKFEHPRGGQQGVVAGNGGAQRNLFGGGGGGNNNGGQKVTFRDSFGAANNNSNTTAANNMQFRWNSGQQAQGGTQNTSQSSAIDLVNALPKEMDDWERTKMWPFSCLSVEKELPCLPEFHDISVEEVRLEAYQAQKSATMPAFNQKFQGLIDQYQTKRNQLRNMNMDVKQKLASFIEDARRKKGSQASSTPGSTTSSVFGSANSSSGQGLFGQNTSGTTAGTSLFGKPAAGTATSAFGNVSSVFGNKTTSTNPVGPFGAQTPQSGGSLFGGGVQNSSTANSLFGKPMGGQTSTFGSTGNANAGSLFGKPAQPATGNSMFGTFGNTAATTPGTTGLFGKPASTTGTGSVFGSTQPAAPSPFGGGQTATSGGLFGSSPAVPTGLFGKPAATVGSGGSVFGAPAAVGGSVFGGATATPGGGLLPTPNANSSIASLLPTPSSGGVAGTVPTGLFGKGPAAGTNTTPATTTPGFGGLFGKGGGGGGGQGASTGAGLFGSSPSAATTTPATGLFGKPAPTPVGGGGSVFVGLGGGPSAGQDPAATDKCYSAMADLSAQDIEAFKANMFTPGKIPIKPPPRELVSG